jgi:hypothetical protein
MSERRVIDVDTWQRYRAVYTLIAFLQQHPEMVDNIRKRHRQDSYGECYDRCGSWPCLMRCCAEEALRQPKRAVA